MCLWASFCCTDEGTQTWPVWMTWPMSHCWQNSDSIPAAWAWSVYSTIRYCKHLGITICWTTSVTHQHLNRVPILLSQYPVWTYQKWYSLVVNGLCLGFNKPPPAVRLKEHSTVFWTHPEKRACDPSAQNHPRGSLLHAFGSPFSVTSSEFLLDSQSSWNSLPLPCHILILLHCSPRHLSLIGDSMCECICWLFAFTAGTQSPRKSRLGFSHPSICSA